MSFTDSAAEVLNRAEVSLSSLITDALKAKGVPPSSRNCRDGGVGCGHWIWTRSRRQEGQYGPPGWRHTDRRHREGVRTGVDAAKSDVAPLPRRGPVFDNVRLRTRNTLR